MRLLMLCKGTGEVYVAAHSLGNMVVLAALNPRAGIDGLEKAFAPARITRHLAFNAAVAAEAIDGATPKRLEMVHSEYETIREDLWASEWYKLFEDMPNDGRAQLTWRDRLANTNGATIYNFYSSGEEVLDYRRLDERVSKDGKPVPTKSYPLAIWELLDWNGFKFNRVGNRSWYYQEVLKGQANANINMGADVSLKINPYPTVAGTLWSYKKYGVSVELNTDTVKVGVELSAARTPGWLGSRYGGWGAGAKYAKEEGVSIPLTGLRGNAGPIGVGFGLGLTWRGALDAAEINAKQWEWFDKAFEPVFLYGNDEVLGGTAGDKKISALLEDSGGDAAYRHQSKLLAEMIPARSVAVGREAVEHLGDMDKFNFDLSTEQFYDSWPVSRLADDDMVFANKKPRWLHGDSQTLPYLYNHALFDKWIELSNLK